MSRDAIDRIRVELGKPGNRPAVNRDDLELAATALELTDEAVLTKQLQVQAKQAEYDALLAAHLEFVQAQG